MADGENQTTADRGAGIEILSMPAELDLATASGVVEQGRAAIARSARLLLLNLTGLSFCDARGLSAFGRIANHADAAGCRYLPPPNTHWRYSRLQPAPSVVILAGLPSVHLMNSDDATLSFHGSR